MTNLLEMDLTSLGFEIDVTHKLPGWDDYNEAIDQMDLYVSPMLYAEMSDVTYAYDIIQEAVTNNHQTAVKKIKTTVKNTKQTTKDLWNVHGDITDSGGIMAKSWWDLAMSGIRIFSRIIVFISNNLAKLPRMVNVVLEKMLKLPDNILNKIKGNFTLNIDYNSLSTFHSEILPLMDRFIADAGEVVAGTSWKVLFQPGYKPTGIFDMAKSLFNREKTKIDDMGKTAKKLSSFNISNTMIDCTKPENVEVYFGATGCVPVIVQGINKKLNYYEALQNLNKTLINHHDSIKALVKASDVKYTRNLTNSSFGKLTENQQKQVQGIVVTISTVFSVVAKMIRAVLEDMNTLYQQYKKIESRFSGSVNDDIKNDVVNKDVNKQLIKKYNQ